MGFQASTRARSIALGGSGLATSLDSLAVVGSSSNRGRGANADRWSSSRFMPSTFARAARIHRLVGTDEFSWQGR